MHDIRIQKIPYGGWENCIQITNDIVDLIVTTDIGPRIIRYGFVGQENEMCEVTSTMGMKGGNEWRIYGGHRLWHSPESRERTYQPDNSPVRWEGILNGIKTTQDKEPLTHIIKEIEITLSQENTGVKILHRLTNLGVCPIELSVWSISAMAAGGKEIIPHACKDTGLLPNRVLSLWPYTNLTDSRIFLGDKYIILQQDQGIKHPLKFGISNENGWAAYFNHNHLFIKYHSHQKDMQYPDFGVSYETYTNDFMLEMETLSPLTILEPGSSVDHMERWELFDDLRIPANEEPEIEKIMTKMVSTDKIPHMDN